MNLSSKTNFISIFQDLWNHRHLIVQMTRRDILSRYRGSLIGIFWSFFNPLLMLIVYTFFFSTLMKMRWGTMTQSKIDFALFLFTGLIPYSLLTECLHKAPTLVTQNVNYVKKVVFPLQILSCISLGAALFHAVVSSFVLLLAFAVMKHYMCWTTFLFPLINLPFVLLILGLGWFLSSLGVYLRDINQAVGILTSILLFLSPVFYPVTALPEAYRWLVYLNPLSFIIEQNRAILLLNQQPDWQSWGIYSLCCAVIAWLGFYWFQKTRRGFADVL